eukprot:CAMPEP_0115738316 /NCGR_PEP_ID=MMETSP0272-20121206/88317_1 /TAXON_ID=71861 /ORGANISM="Scrippsiella trochoidea, Strain CCMP3099" /LENGTH=66 /DNA_ID=CAMNT_0003182739 /DNA_START=50 /DNA_END=247 /DNA_ORIENTATION=+
MHELTECGAEARRREPLHLLSRPEADPQALAPLRWEDPLEDLLGVLLSPRLLHLPHHVDWASVPVV